MYQELVFRDFLSLKKIDFFQFKLTNLHTRHTRQGNTHNTHNTLFTQQNYGLCTYIRR